MEQRPISPDDVFWQLASLNQRIARIEQLLELLPILLVRRSIRLTCRSPAQRRSSASARRPFAAESELGGCDSTCTSELVAPGFRLSKSSMDGWIYASPEQRWLVNAHRWRRRTMIDDKNGAEVGRLHGCHRNRISVARIVACGKLGGKTLAKRQFW